ncbi:MAG: radical SAM protein [Acidobacteriia bacterium]|nr:radical SAM protein [Terriglobia bacterium]
MLLDLKQGVTYGPVRSRRLGRSLGINLLGSAAKVCTFDCLYCQYGWTPPDSASGPDGPGLPSPQEVFAAVESALAGLDEPPSYLTFSGNGEPTLHPRFGEIVDGVSALRDRLAPGARTAVLSNSTRVHDPRVREALARLDVRIMKLDAGTEETFRRFNRPPEGVSLAEVLDGLRSLDGLTIQTLVAEGPDGNANAWEIHSWVDAVVSVRPVAVQLYTLARGYPSDRIGPVGARLLEAIRDRLLALDVSASVY